jgi:hypothetical protein
MVADPPIDAFSQGLAWLTPAAGVLRHASGAPGAPLVLAGALELAALIVLVLLQLSQRRFRTVF